MKIMNSFWANGNGGVLRRRVPLIGIVLLVFSGCQSCGNVGTVGNGMEPPQSGIISGTIVITSDASSSLAPGGDNEYRPVADARVRIVGSGQEAVATDDDGNFEIEVAGGEHLLIAEKVDADGEKHMLGTKVTVKNGFTTRLDTPLLLQQAGALVGLVRLADAKEDAHEGILVQLENTDLFALTDEHGSYTLPGVPAGEFVVVASRIGYTTAKSNTIVIEAGKVSTVEDMSLEEDRNAGVEGSLVEGMILDAGSGKGIEAAFVAIKGGGLGAVSNDEGQYKIWLPAGRFDLLAVAPGYESQTREVDTSSGGDGVGNTTLDFELTAEEGDHQAVFEGKILHAVNAAPVASVVVVADPARGQAVSDKDGLFSLSLPEGCYRFTFAKGGFVSRQLTRCGSGGQQIELGSIELTEQVPMCVPEAEVCDNVDNDCNGVVDDGGVCGAPQTNIADPGFRLTWSANVSLQLQSDKADHFECSLDGVAFGNCNAAWQSGNLAPGVHNLKARAVDSAGVADPTPAEFSWNVGEQEYLGAGKGSNCYLKRDGTISCWGDNKAAQMGDGTFVDRPTPVSRGTGWSQLASGYQNHCALDSNDNLFCWGWNIFNQFAMSIPTGLGLTGGGWEYTPSPIQVTTKQWKHVAVGTANVCGVDSSDSLFCWAAAFWGLLGDGGAGVYKSCPNYPQRDCTESPVQIPGNDWFMVFTGSYSNCALKKSGKLFCWGQNDTGQLGLGRSSSTLCTTNEGISASCESLPQEILHPNPDAYWIDISVGYASTCALDNNLALWCWGDNSYGQTGTSGGDASCSSGTCFWVPQKVQPGTTWKKVSVGRWHACGITIGGDLKCWGQNDYGRTGEGALWLPNQILTPQAIADGGAKWQQLAVEHYHSCATKMDGTVWCWGANDNGELGSGTLGSATTCNGNVLGGVNYGCYKSPQAVVFP